jgi:drug/metabolite transporter (DMT)-like permease
MFNSVFFFFSSFARHRILPFSMAASVLVLGRRFTVSQLLGVVCVIAGVLISIIPAMTTSGGVNIALNAALFCCSCAFLGFAIVLKEVALHGRKRGKHRAATDKPPIRFDVFTVNTFSSTCQLLGVLLLLPITLLLAPVNGGMWPYITRGVSMMFNAPYMPWLTLCYVGFNILFNIFGLTLMKEASSTVALISTVSALPLVSLIFCLPLPLLTPSPFSWFTCASLAVVMAGVCVYNWRPRPAKLVPTSRQSKTAD